MSTPRDVEMLYQAEHIAREAPQQLAEARTQDDYHRVEVSLQIAQAMALVAIGDRLGYIDEQLFQSRRT